MLLFPAASGLLKLPAVDDVSIQYQAVTIDVFKEISHFGSPGMLGTQVNVRQDNSWIVLSSFHVVFINTIQKKPLPVTARQQSY